jgi:hypothetical protein
MHTNGTVFVDAVGASKIGLAIMRALLDKGPLMIVADLAQGSPGHARQEPRPLHGTDRRPT